MEPNAYNVTLNTTFRDHSYREIVYGDAHTPARFWELKLLTESEYDQLDELHKTLYRTIEFRDLPLLESLFKD